MRHHFRTFTARHEPHGAASAHLKSGFGALLGILLVGGLAMATALPLLVAPLGATVVLLFGQPNSPLSQPMNVFGGYFIGTIAGAAAAVAFPGVWWVAAIAVGVAIASMAALRVTHPPAGAVPLMALATAEESTLLFVTLLIACISLVALAVVYHRLPPRIQYPKQLLHPPTASVPSIASSSASIPNNKAA